MSLSLFLSLRQLCCPGVQLSQSHNFTRLPLQLNAFDSRHLDEVHFDVRLTAFQGAMQRIKDMEALDMNYLHTVIYNCFHSFEVSLPIPPKYSSFTHVDEGETGLHQWVEDN